MINKCNNHLKDYTVIDNSYLKRNDLSWDAKGLLTYLLTLPEDFIINLNHLKNMSSDGITVARTSLNELINKGYAKKYTKRLPTGEIVNHDYIISEISIQ